MFNLDQHEAYNELKQYEVIKQMIQCLFEQKNYCFNVFNDMIPEAADVLAKEIMMKGKGEYHNTTFKKLEDLSAKIKGDIFEIFVMFTLQYFKGPDIWVKEGTYTQVPDEEDAGMDFFGILESDRNTRVFGQIKFRNPNGKLSPEEMAFTRRVAHGLIGDAVINKDFDLTKDVLIFVTNRLISDSLHYRLANEIGWAGNSPDNKHGYMRFIDSMTLQNKIGFNYRSFWEDFLNEF